jgi:hypothetical protein
MLTKIRGAVAVTAASLLLVVGGFVVTGASAAGASAVPHSASKPKPKTYQNCTDLNATYPHGVAKSGAKDKVSGSSKPVTTFTVDSRTYALNKKSDRDKDGVACEKK